MASVLNVLIPAAVIGYAIWVIVRMQKRKGCCGCSGCPLANECQKKKEGVTHE